MGSSKVKAGKDKLMTLSDWMKQRLKAQFTVEAALLMAIILPVLVCVLFAGFFLHDRIYVNGICLEAVSTFINMKNAGEDDGAGYALPGKLKTGTIWLKDTAGFVSSEGENVTAQAFGNFTAGLMGLQGAVLPGQIYGSAQAQNQDPAQLIRKIKGVRYFIDEALADSGS